MLIIYRIISLIAIIVLACACGGGRDRSSGGDFCASYASQCPAEPDLEMCNADCANGTDPTAGSCWFKACAAMVGKCDNEERGDPSILLCAADNGWYDISDGCTDLADYCNFCPDATQMATCQSVVDAGDGRACIEHLYEVQDCI